MSLRRESRILDRKEAVVRFLEHRGPSGYDEIREGARVDSRAGRSPIRDLSGILEELIRERRVRIEPPTGPGRHPRYALASGPGWQVRPGTFVDLEGGLSFAGSLTALHYDKDGRLVRPAR